MRIFIKPNGAELPVSESSESHARTLGWIPKDELKVPAAEEAADETPKRKYTRKG